MQIEILFFQLFRHGARTLLEIDVELLPQYNEPALYHPWGFAQLTKQGMMQEYAIGKMLRNRYEGFLSDLYKPEELYAYSSNTERTIASLQLVLAALYPPVGEQKWNENLPWIPIPIRTIPRPLDILMNPRFCPKYTEKLKEVFNFVDIKSSKYMSTIKKVSEILGKPVDYSAIFGLYNVLKINKSLKIHLPRWYTDELFKDMESVSEFFLDILSYTSNLKRLNGGPMVRRILENILSSNSNMEKRKLYLYSAHEMTLHAYMRSHNITRFGIPNYGDAILVEKYRSIENQYYVKLLYWTGKPKQMHVLKLENCSEICPIQSYLEIVKPSLPTDDEMLCLLKNLDAKGLNTILNADYVK